MFLWRPGECCRLSKEERFFVIEPTYLPEDNYRVVRLGSVRMRQSCCPGTDLVIILKRINICEGIKLSCWNWEPPTANGRKLSVFMSVVAARDTS